MPHNLYLGERSDFSISQNTYPPTPLLTTYMQLVSPGAPSQPLVCKLTSKFQARVTIDHAKIIMGNLPVSVPVSKIVSLSNAQAEDAFIHIDRDTVVCSRKDVTVLRAPFLFLLFHHPDLLLARTIPRYLVLIAS